MKIDSRFQARRDTTIRLTIDGEQVMAKPGDSVASALLAHSGDATRVSDKGFTSHCFLHDGCLF